MKSSWIGYALLFLAACGGQVVVNPGGSGGAGTTTTTWTTTTWTTTTWTTTTWTTTTTGPTSCDPAEVWCNSPMPFCEPGMAPSVVDGCWDACIPLLDCPTVPSCDDCQGLCAVYVGSVLEYRCLMVGLTCSSTDCACLGQFFCVDPFDVCFPGSGYDAMVACECFDC